MGYHHHNGTGGGLSKKSKASPREEAEHGARIPRQAIVVQPHQQHHSRVKQT